VRWEMDINLALNDVINYIVFLGCCGKHGIGDDENELISPCSEMKYIDSEFL